MSKQHFEEVCSPFDPYSKEKLGWIDPIEVTDSLSEQPITDFMSTGVVYKLAHKGGEYFLVSNHKRDLPNTSRWEREFPGKGLLIWHVDTTGNNMLYRHHKRVDLESGHGLYDDLGGENPIRNDSTGVDSLDDAAHWGIGFPTCFFNDSTKTAFNDTSNPTTDGYVYSPGHGFPDNYKQTALTGICVNNIQGAGGDTMWADFCPPIIYWGPDTVYITGDFVVQSPSKLHIFPGTVVIFDTTDDQQKGYDESKCEIIVEGVLEAFGTEEDSIHFLSISPTRSDSDWYGITVDSGGSAQFSYCDFRNAYTAINYGNGTDDSVTHCRFGNNFEHAVKTENDNLFIDSCVIENNSTGGDDEIYGILCYGSSPTIKNTFIKNCIYGIKAATPARTPVSPFIEECGFYDIGQVGIWINGVGSPTIKNCCFKGTFGKACMEIYRASPEIIYRCYMASQGSGIVTGMLFENGAGGSIRRTTIWDYDSCAVEIYGSGTHPDFGTSDSAGNNWFARTGYRYFISSPPSTMMAEKNYWETEDSAAIDDKIDGDVDFSPFLGVCFRPNPYYPDICSDLPPDDPTFTPCKIAVTDQGKMPESFAISQNYPNPFNPQTVIKYDLPEPAHVRITVYNILGQKVRTLVDEEQEAGSKSIKWDGQDDQRNDAATGIYFYLIRAGDFSKVKKMVLLK